MPGPGRVNSPSGRGFPMMGSGVGPNDPLDHSERGATVYPTPSTDLSDVTRQAGANTDIKRASRRGANAGNRRSTRIDTPSAP